MIWPFLGTIFFLSIIFTLGLLIGFIFKPQIWKKNKSRIKIFYIAWFTPYLLFFFLFTGPENLSLYPPQVGSPYKLPWKAGVTRFVGQGNHSFTSHRGLHRFAWDFVMANGTEILAARAGRVLTILDSFDGIGLHSNFIEIVHEDGQRSMYAHIRHNGSLVKVGDIVQQGQPIALSGMVGQTIYPHVHFLVFNSDGSDSIPISFVEIPGGVPLAGRFYTSQNEAQ